MYFRYSKVLFVYKLLLAVLCLLVFILARSSFYRRIQLSTKRMEMHVQGMDTYSEHDVILDIKYYHVYYYQNGLKIFSTFQLIFGAISISSGLALHYVASTYLTDVFILYLATSLVQIICVECLSSFAFQDFGFLNTMKMVDNLQGKVHSSDESYFRNQPLQQIPTKHSIGSSSIGLVQETAIMASISVFSTLICVLIHLLYFSQEETAGTVSETLGRWKRGLLAVVRIGTRGMTYVLPKETVIKLKRSSDSFFVEAGLQPGRKTLYNLKQTVASSFRVDTEDIEKLLKNGDTLISSDVEVSRLVNQTEIIVVLKGEEYQPLQQPLQQEQQQKRPSLYTIDREESGDALLTEVRDVRLDLP